MLPLPRFAVAALCVVLPSLVTGCASVTVGSHVARDVDFARSWTYSWGPADALPTGDARLDNNPFFNDHLQGAVERRLAARGWEVFPSGSPELLIHYHANVARRFDLDSIDGQLGRCYGSDCGGRIREYEAGTLVLDIVDARTNRVVWRGWAQNSMEGIFDNQDRLERMINSAVERMLQRLPRSF